MATFQKGMGSQAAYWNHNRTVERTRDESNSKPDTCYGSSWMDPRKGKIYQYEIFLDKADRNVWVGIAKEAANPQEEFMKKRGNGAIRCNQDKTEITMLDPGHYRKSPFIAESGDTVTLIVDYTRRSLTYKINNQIAGTDAVEYVPYKLAVALGERWAKVTIMKYETDAVETNPSTQPEKKVASSSRSSKGIFSGYKFVLSGTLSLKHIDVSTMIIQRGGKVSNQPEDDTDYVVQSDGDVDNVKTRKAKKLGIPLINETFIYDSIKEHRFLDVASYTFSVSKESSSKKRKIKKYVSSDHDHEDYYEEPPRKKQKC